MRKIKKFLSQGISPIIAIIIVLFVGIVVVSGILTYIFLWHPTEPQNQQNTLNNSETANWKTY